MTTQQFSHWPTLCSIACKSLITGQSFDQTVNAMYNKQAVANELQRAQYLKIKRANREQDAKPYPHQGIVEIVNEVEVSQ